MPVFCSDWDCSKYVLTMLPASNLSACWEREGGGGPGPKEYWKEGETVSGSEQILNFYDCKELPCTCTADTIKDLQL